jgi:hypothetical protein
VVFVTADANSDVHAHIEMPVSTCRAKAGALLVRCTDEEAESIRHAAKSERRTISGFILNAVNIRIQAREKLQQETNLPQKTPVSTLTP